MTATLGKAPGNTLFIDDDPRISARHLTLTRTAFGLVVSAPGSTNGTWVVFHGQHQGGSRISEWSAASHQGVG